MNLETILPWAAAGGIACLIYALTTMFSGTKSRASERLDELRDPSLRRGAGGKGKSTGDGGGGSVSEAIGRAAPKLSKALESKSALEQSNLKVRLANAGYNSPNASQYYLAIKLFSLGGCAMLGLGYGTMMYGMTQKAWMSLAIGGGLGFYIPELVLLILRCSRQGKIFLQLPDALDLLVVCVEAGLGLDAGMRKVAEELADTAPEVCCELDAANMHLQMGRPRREVLRELGIRTGVDDVRALAAILIQADKFGSSIAQALRVQSDSMRIKRRQIAEEKAAATAVKMIFPLVLFIFPGIFVVLVGPAAIMLINNLLNT
jgi:tight adherence protein C